MAWFRKKDEQRADSLYTTEQLAGASARASGGAGDAVNLAVAEACIGLWERALASALVEPRDNRRLAGLTPMFLSLTGRALASRGELVAALDVRGGRVAITPVASHDITGDADVSSWVYRCDFQGPSTARTARLDSESILHFRIGADASAPWRGRAPLARARNTAGLAADVENAMRTELALPIGRIAPFAGVPDQIKGYIDAVTKGGMISYAASTPIGASSGQEPSARHKPQAYGPEPNDVLRALRSDIGQEICNAFGIPPSLFDPDSAGPAQLASIRRFWATTIAPIARVLESEIRNKLDQADAMITLPQLAASDEDARSRAVQRRAGAFKTFTDAGVQRAEALRLAGL